MEDLKTISKSIKVGKEYIQAFEFTYTIYDPATDVYLCDEFVIIIIFNI
jgi:hypothetical protein